MWEKVISFFYRNIVVISGNTDFWLFEYRFPLDTHLRNAEVKESNCEPGFWAVTSIMQWCRRFYDTSRNSWQNHQLSTKEFVCNLPKLALKKMESYSIILIKINNIFLAKFIDYCFLNYFFGNSNRWYVIQIFTPFKFIWIIKKKNYRSSILNPVFNNINLSIHIAITYTNFSIRLFITMTIRTCWHV